MVLTVDIGNTRIKAAVFEGDILIENVVFEKSDYLKKIEIILNKYSQLADLVISSVSDLDKAAFLSFSSRLKIHFITHKDSFPFQNLYATPHTLGIDRMVLAAGATLKFPNTNRLVIDAGTCVTFDCVTQDNCYLGGAITPGLRMRYEALHHFTAKLPLLSTEVPDYFIGNSTAQAIHSGVVKGLVYEIDGYINDFKEKYPNFIIILTGGDAVFLAMQLKNTIFANSNFLLESLNQTFQYAINND